MKSVVVLPRRQAVRLVHAEMRQEDAFVGAKVAGRGRFGGLVARMLQREGVHD